MLMIPPASRRPLPSATAQCLTLCRVAHNLEGSPVLSAFGENGSRRCIGCADLRNRLLGARPFSDAERSQRMTGVQDFLYNENVRGTIRVMDSDEVAAAFQDGPTVKKTMIEIVGLYKMFPQEVLALDDAFQTDRARIAPLALPPMFAEAMGHEPVPVLIDAPLVSGAAAAPTCERVDQVA